jgi:DNA-binding transcriptional regulator PaaX
MWSFLTNHGLVLVHLGGRPDSTGLEIARAVGITERAARAIVAALEAEGYVAREKVGRRNRYRVDTARTLRLPGDRTVPVGALLEVLGRAERPAAQASPP